MFFSSAHLRMFCILYLEINKVVEVEVFCKNMDGINVFISTQEIFGKMGVRDQNYGKKIGISGSRIYHVTNLFRRQIEGRSEFWVNWPIGFAVWEKLSLRSESLVKSLVLAFSLDMQSLGSLRKDVFKQRTSNERGHFSFIGMQWLSPNFWPNCL